MCGVNIVDFNPVHNQNIIQQPLMFWLVNEIS